MAIITACGSGKNKELIHLVCKKLEEKGHIVLTPPLHNIGKYTVNMDLEGETLLWKGATFAHLNRIKTANVCIMVNPKGYLGVGSTLELGYAVSLGKLVIALQHDDELARESLFDIVLETEDVEEIAEKVDTLLKK
ncbi:MAG: nucleoside 2-deoxyribosyltransferase [Lachnospiraceae bacterium]|nr:nucleoside 2-deoxyribosyltransferase [Lachnospiraceae bacterium]